MDKRPVCYYCGESYGVIKDIGEPGSPLLAHVPACASQKDIESQAREEAHRISHNGDVKVRWH